MTTSLLLQWRQEEVAHPVAERLTILEREIHFTSEGKLPVQRVKNAFAIYGDEPVPVISATPLTAAGFPLLPPLSPSAFTLKLESEIESSSKFIMSFFVRRSGKETSGK